MKRGVIGALGLALAVAVLTTVVTTFDAASAQEAEPDQERVVQAFSVLGGGSHLGVRIEDVDSELVEELGLPGEYGVHVGSVVEGGPAEEAGVEDGDVILNWNGERVQSAAQLQRLVRETPAGRTVRLGLFREGNEREVSVTLGDSSDRFENLRITTAPRFAQELRERIRTAVPGGVRMIGPGDVRVIGPEGTRLRSPGGVRIASFFGERGRLGVSVQNLSDQLAEYFGVDGGALVVSVVEDSPAEAAGIQAGDVITAVADDDVEDPGDLIEALGEREAGPVTVRVVRDGQERSITVELEEANDWQHEEGDHDGGLSYRMWSDQDAPFAFHMEPFEMPAFDVGPIEFEGFEMEPFEWHFEFEGMEGDEPHEIDISIPAIEIPGFEMPAIELPAINVPGFEVVAPRVTITTGV
jgi:serine protease Do